MFKEGIFSFEAPYKTEADLYKSLLKCYDLVCSKNITDREIEFLTIYLKYDKIIVNKFVVEGVKVKCNWFEIKNFKGIKSAVLKFNNSPKSNIIVLVGLNESGKTTILELVSPHVFLQK